ncbi:GFA family protein [Paraliomyxa miuraensis]|uniref:GFA family protein n=1 Tax=Paraliomyxa miuraensis TaxID=376150 RepID=UPI00224E8DA3|nr:GFA family protein [Paraliomyxa miuraensis]MCX4246218.1 GFA family protein [Paraliomyxa miuraensis]
MTTYHGGCHCGAVRYEVELELDTVIACNCSICAKEGWRLAFVPAAAFTLRQGEDALRDYQFGNHHIHHLFCTTCGIRSFTWGTGSDGAKMYSVNVRCLDGVDAESLKVQHYDGASL